VVEGIPFVAVAEFLQQGFAHFLPDLYVGFLLLSGK